MAIAIMSEKSWAFNDTDTLPTEGVQDGQTAINRDTGELFIFDLENRIWKNPIKA